MITRIGIDYTAGIHQSAGIGRYTREMVNALATVTPGNGFKPQYRLFVADQDRNFGPSLPGTNFTWCPSRLTERWLARLWYRLRLPLPIQYWTGPLNLFHATDFVLPPVKRGTRTIVTIHDLSFVRRPETTMPGMSLHLKKWVPYSVQRADHVIAVSEATRQDLIDLYHTSPEKISVLYHGVNPEFRPAEEKAKLKAIRQKYKLGERSFILSVGTIQPRKNYQRLIRAFAKIDSPVSLVIAGGKGWNYKDIFDEVARQGLANRVHFPGFVADADLPVLYRAATLFIYPSLYEGFGLPALEAMACGTPVVASNQSSLPEVVGQAGLLINSQDEGAITAAMDRMLADKSLRQTLSEAGLKQAAKFSWPGMAKKLAALYEKVLQEK
jgi:glycosyltransferase involved in cell wall biosynthesis